MLPNMKGFKSKWYFALQFFFLYAIKGLTHHDSFIEKSSEHMGYSIISIDFLERNKTIMGEHIDYLQTTRKPVMQLVETHFTTFSLNSVNLSVALQPFVGPWPLPHFLDLL
jgi:hypothetical protein